jgi:hypothetical protein
MLPVKVCSCGARYTAAEWQALPLCGYWYTPADDTGPEVNLELRQCTCQSTIAVELPPVRFPTQSPAPHRGARGVEVCHAR